MCTIAFFAYFPTVVAPVDLVPANARVQTSYSVAQVGGAGLGGWLLKVLGAAPVFLFSLATFLVAALAFLRVRVLETPPEPAPQGQSYWLKVSSGFRVMLRDPVLRAMLAEGAWFNFCEQAFMTVFFVFAVRDLGLTTDVVGYCIGLGSIGAIVGSFTASGAGHRLGKAKVLILAMGLASVGPLLVPLASGHHPSSVVLAALSFCCYGFGLTIYNVHSISERQSRMESSALGRANAAFQTVVLGALPLGAAAGGGMAELFGNRPALVVIGLLLIAAWVPFSLTITRNLKGVNSPDADPARASTSESRPA
jgi:predicted MFS family arabinose efflux permease